MSFSSLTSRSKGTRRPLAVLEIGFYQGLGASFRFRWRRAPYRNVRGGSLRLPVLGLGGNPVASLSFCACLFRGGLVLRLLLSPVPWGSSPFGFSEH